VKANVDKLKATKAKKVNQLGFFSNLVFFFSYCFTIVQTCAS